MAAYRENPTSLCPIWKLQYHRRNGLLVGPEVYDFRNDLLLASATKKETINALNYSSRFSTIFASDRPSGPGFDCIVSNPPYVRIQNFKKSIPRNSGFPAQCRDSRKSRDFKAAEDRQLLDIDRPFVERGFWNYLTQIYGSVILLPAYGGTTKMARDLRKLIGAGGNLDRWVDSHHTRSSMKQSYILRFKSIAADRIRPFDLR